MIKIEKFDNVISSGITYGGHSGSKRGIILNGERWFLKYPKSTKSMDVKNLSYTTSPLSEYIASQIYKIIGFEVHETKLGIANGKVVVACKDFLDSNEVILDYNAIKNDYDEAIEKAMEDLSSSSSITSNDIDEVLIVMEKNSFFLKVPELKDRFWDMFVIDALIGNNDRNEGNWGLVLNKDTGKLRVAPVYDNGAAFNSKSSEERLINIYEDEFKFKQSVYDSSVSTFTKNDKNINPLKYIEQMENPDCNKAILRIVPRIDLDKIEDMINSIPKEEKGLNICSDIQKDFYFKAMKYRYEKVFCPTYDKLLNKDIEIEM